MNKHTFTTIALILTSLVSGCAAKPSGQEAQSFSMAQSAQTTPAAPSTVPAATSSPNPAAAAVVSSSPKLPTEQADKQIADPSPAPSPAQGAGTQTKRTENLVQASSSTKSKPEDPGQPTTVANGAPTTAPTSPASTPTSKKSSANEISWSGFFDDEKQNTPSNKFWDLQDQTVHINGFMGEVLSFEKHWFLLIPEPGAECPFDNGDETYWNKIMIVFVPDSEKLRFTSGPLKITGRLDVGVKVDESGYKTMFRLYDAKVEKIKE